MKTSLNLESGGVMQGGASAEWSDGLWIRRSSDVNAYLAFRSSLRKHGVICDAGLTLETVMRRYARGATDCENTFGRLR